MKNFYLTHVRVLHSMPSIGSKFMAQETKITQLVKASTPESAREALKKQLKKELPNADVLEVRVDELIKGE
jgi:hypothetical protein